ncbi:cellulose binding domain-containing protein [Streptomyces europaeiscabiei]|uniref:cellulose binding domain-containing protein n=1 Tax=Streptomyces europaeiscabiei TaxID=146819 RepID=UPI0029AAADD2|nr:cellulose binding domain-containing protein [Streptomyces europaeiscabiei]MDX2524362.1 cellulose binding domain-containing protein [Streptomyces europaeiscabiei]
MMTRTRSLLWPALVAVLLVLTMGGTALAGGHAGSAPPAASGTAAAASGTAAAASGTAAATPGCGKAPTLTSGTHTIQSGGRNRSFILRIPDGYDRNRAYRLVFGFHWLGGTSTDVATGRTVETGTWAYYGLQRLANNSAIFVAPQGLNNGWANAGGEDVTLVDGILRRIEDDLCVDTTQRFALGFSYGAAMSYALACSRATVFRAVAVQSGGQLSGCSGGTQPIAYLGVHGLRDSVLGISGGRTMRDRFVRNNGCTAQNPPEPTQGSLTHRVTTYSGCSAGHPVAWAAFDEGHIAAPQDGAGGDSGSRTWLPTEVWKFFTQFQNSTPSPGTSLCRVSHTISGWNTGLTSNITLTNTGTTPIDGWSLAFTLPGGQTITSAWNADYSPASGRVTARNVSHNATIAPGASVDIGFQASHTGDTASPTSYTLNGTACAVAGSSVK